jgi:DNA-binding SARP family transcriptional activator
MNELRVAFLGGYGVDRGGHAVKELAGQPIRSALFALLVLERALTREEVVGMLWSDSAPVRGRHSLS